MTTVLYGKTTIIIYSVAPENYYVYTQSVTYVTLSCVNPNDDDSSDYNDYYYADDGYYNDTIWLPKSPLSQLVNYYYGASVITHGVGSQLYYDRYSDCYYANDTIVQATGSSFLYIKRWFFGISANLFYGYKLLFSVWT